MAHATAKKTAGKTTAASKPAKVPQAHGGALNNGGTPGNKGGGRKPLEYVEFLRGTLDSKKHRDVLEDLLTTDNVRFLGATELANGYVRGKPAATVNVHATVQVLWDL